MILYQWYHIFQCLRTTEVLFRFFLESNADDWKEKNSSKRNPIQHCYSMHAEVGTQHRHMYYIQERPDRLSWSATAVTLPHTVTSSKMRKARVVCMPEVVQLPSPVFDESTAEKYFCCTACYHNWLLVYKQYKDPDAFFGICYENLVQIWTNWIALPRLLWGRFVEGVLILTNLVSIDSEFKD
jgi:hypothetical protein